MRILIIEDDREISSFLERGFRDAGFAVDTAADGGFHAVMARITPDCLAVWPCLSSPPPSRGRQIPDPRQFTCIAAADAPFSCRPRYGRRCASKESMFR